MCKKTLSNTTINLIHLNIQGITNKLNDLTVLLNESEAEIACVTESWLTKEEAQIFGLQNWITAASFSRTNFIHGGVTIFCKNQNYVNLSEINELSVEMDCEATSILFPDKKLIVVVIYRSPNGNFVSFLEILEKNLNNLNLIYNVCICGDFNVKFNTSNHQTNSLIELLSCYGFSQTIFGSTRGTNCLDNVFLNFSKENYKFVFQITIV